MHSHVTKGDHADGLPDAEADAWGHAAVEAANAVVGVDVHSLVEVDWGTEKGATCDRTPSWDVEVRITLEASSVSSHTDEDLSVAASTPIFGTFGGPDGDDTRVSTIKIH